jgi:hypothetical protein
MKYPFLTKFLIFALGIGLDSTASAQLLSRAGGAMVYDTEQNITWLADANYADTQYKQSNGRLGFEAGRMDHRDALKWVSELVYAGVSGWRLPKTKQPDTSCERQTVVGSHGFFCTGSEMGHLFYGDSDHGLGGKEQNHINLIHNQNFQLFHNISDYGVYWYSDDFPSLPFIARNFEMRYGFSNAYSKSVMNNVWPVHDGDVGGQ